jgi:hypothetical protein
MKEPTEIGKTSPCPTCGSHSVARIVYGLLNETEDLMNAILRGEIVPGGCCVWSDDRSCNDCFGKWKAPSAP